MKRYVYTSAALAICIIFFISNNKVKEEKEIVRTASKELKVVLESKSGSSVSGEILFTEEDGVVHMMAQVKGLAPGIHAIHLHEKADCSANDGTSTGGHWNPTMEPHGKWGAANGYHKGDIGNLEADKKGNASLHFETAEWCIGCGDDKKDIMGKAVIVHQAFDDFTTQPTGNAGGRIACAGLIK